MRQDVEFVSEGDTVRGWFFTPEDGKAPDTPSKTGLVEPCAREDSNLWPQPPQGCALSPELRAREGKCSRGQARRRRRASRPGARGCVLRHSS